MGNKHNNLDYIISNELQIDRVVLQNNRSEIRTSMPIKIYASPKDKSDCIDESLVSFVTGECVTKNIPLSESSFEFQENIYKSLKWNTLDLADRMLHIQLKPGLLETTGDDLFPYKYKPWHVSLYQLYRIISGRNDVSESYVAAFQTFGSPEVSGDASKYDIKLFIPEKDYTLLKNTSPEYKFVLKLSLD